MEIVDKYMNNEVRSAMARVNENQSVIGTVIVNNEGFPETTTLDSLTAAKYTTLMRQMASRIRDCLREIETDDDLMVLRVLTKKNEVIVVPDKEFHLIMVMAKTKKRAGF